MLIVNSGLPLMKARVPSSGSTRKNAFARHRHASGRHRFLSDDRDARRGAMQPFRQHLLGLVVGDGDWRSVGLRLDFDAGGKVRHLDAPRGKHGGKQRLDQRTVFL